MVVVVVNFVTDTCEVNSPFSSSSSSSEQEKVVQPEPDRGRKRTRRALLAIYLKYSSAQKCSDLERRKQTDMQRSK